MRVGVGSSSSATRSREKFDAEAVSRGGAEEFLVLGSKLDFG
ncbi:hypothetical protein RISK_003342 [Rhodopirellula islandica]|uniref:Uncharacterized protein n=1 Tax=Rhodopirellula islandica TaxID=595434 RepID=A0A0J1BDV4_RHOIS|nr:hypothetical protein RISK_003342 [Rhodopirellula islandica]